MSPRPLTSVHFLPAEQSWETLLDTCGGHGKWTLGRGTLAKFSFLISLLGKWGCNCIAFVTLLDKSHLVKNQVHGFHFPLRYDWGLQKNDSVMPVNLTSEAIVLIWCNTPWLWGMTPIQKTRKFKIYKPDAEPCLWKPHEAD